MTRASGWMSGAPARARAFSAIRRCARRSISPKRFGGWVIEMLSATRQMREQRELLEDAGDAGLGGGGGIAEPDGSALELHGAGVRLHDPGHDLDQGRLSGTVLAEHGVDAAASDLDPGVLERMDAAIALGHPGHAENRRGVHLRPPGAGRGGARGPALRIEATGFPWSAP